MKRLLVLIAVLVPLSLFFAGCGGSKDRPSGQKAGVPSADEQKQLMESMMKNQQQMSKAAKQ